MSLYKKLDQLKAGKGQTIRIVREWITKETQLFSLKTMKTTMKKMDEIVKDSGRDI